MRWALLISLLIHAAVFLALIPHLRHRPQEEWLPPPAEVTMQFETGNKTGPTTPTPSPSPGISAPPLSPPIQAPPAPVPPPAPVTPTPPLPPTPLPPAPVPSAPPPSAAPEAAPEPAPAPKPAEPAPIPKPAAPKAIQRPAPPSKPSEFPMPERFSFGAPIPSARKPTTAPSRPHVPGTIDMTLGPTTRGVLNNTPRSQHDEDVEGADWRNAFAKWVADHAYYPELAIGRQEEGDAVVHVVVSPDGRVKSVELLHTSHSRSLDTAVQALFRDQRIPPLPPGTDDPSEFDFVMHYILILVR